MFRYSCKNLKWQSCPAIFAHLIHKRLECEHCSGYRAGFALSPHVANSGEEEFQSALVVDKEVIVKHRLILTGSDPRVGNLCSTFSV